MLLGAKSWKALKPAEEFCFPAINQARELRASSCHRAPIAAQRIGGAVTAVIVMRR
jgi:hypothetical protein